MTEINIVQLIENNPITKLSNTYNMKLLDKIKTHFSNYEQQMFVASFYCYLHYDKNEFVIDLDNVWQWLGFSTKQKAEMLLEKKFKLDIDYKSFSSFSEKVKKGSGGHNKETILLTIKCFKSFCLKAQTKKSSEIHEYYLKMEEVLQEVVEEESNELKNQLEQVKQEMEQIDETNKKEFMQKVAKEREQFLLREFGSIGSVVYIIKVKTYDNGQYVVKIGESRKGVQLRYNEHKSKYDEVLLLDCFAVKKCKEFENFLHTHEQVRYNRVVDLEGHENEKELFLIGKNLTYKTLLHIINMNYKTFNEFTESDMEKLKTENETLKSIIQTKNTSSNEDSHCPRMENNAIQTLLQNQINMEKQIHNIERMMKEITEKLNANQSKTMTNFNQPLVTLGPRLQQINPENMALIKVYDSVSECMKEFNFKIKRPSINKAITDNTVYLGYRWYYVDRDKDPYVITNIPPTKTTKLQTLGYIAKLNQDKTEILNVYLDRKIAAKCNQYASISALDNPVKNGTITNGYYYMLYEKCPDELCKSFVEKYGEPLLYKDGVGQFNEKNELINEFSCKYDCIKKMRISDKTLTKVLCKNLTYNQFYFKTLGSKWSVLSE